jgi:integrase
LPSRPLAFLASAEGVERAVTDGGRVKGTKTYEIRIVEMTPDLAATLKRHLTWLKAESLRTGRGEPEWLFPTEDGTLMDKDHLGAVFRRLLRRAGLSHHRVDDLRHTYASLLLADGAPHLRKRAARPRQPDHHLRHYARWMPKKGKRWVNALDKTAAGSRFVEPKGGASEDEG